jgi:hypothetical protein
MATTNAKPKSRAEGARQLARSLDQMRSCSDPNAVGVPITEVGFAQCRFIINDAVFPALCCGAGTTRASSWCEYHARVVFTPTGLTYIRQRSRPRGR